MAAIETGSKVPDAIDLSLESTADGPISIAGALANGPVLVGLYKSSCQASKTMFPFLERLHQRHAGTPLTVLGVSQDSLNITRSFARRGGITFPILDKVRGFYPRDTKFVVLPMDMAFMGAGEVKSSLDAQHDELAELAQSADANVIPFVAVDPRRPGVVNSTIERLENGFRGIKLWAVQGIPHPGARGGGANLPRSKD